MDVNHLLQILAKAAVIENSKRRRALEITFLGQDSSTAAAAARVVVGPSSSSGSEGGEPHGNKGVAQGTATAASDSSSSGDYEDDDNLAAAAATTDDADEASYSTHSRQRIQQAPADIAQKMGLPLARCVLLSAAVVTVLVGGPHHKQERGFAQSCFQGVLTLWWQCSCRVVESLSL